MTMGYRRSTVRIVHDDDGAMVLARALREAGVRAVELVTWQQYRQNGADTNEQNPASPPATARWSHGSVTPMDVVLFLVSGELDETSATQQAAKLRAGMIGAVKSGGVVTFWSNGHVIDTMPEPIATYVGDNSTPAVPPPPPDNLLPFPSPPAAAHGRAPSQRQPRQRASGKSVDESPVLLRSPHVMSLAKKRGHGSGYQRGLRPPLLRHSPAECSNTNNVRQATTTPPRSPRAGSPSPFLASRALARRIASLAPIARMEREVGRRNNSLQSLNLPASYHAAGFQPGSEVNVLIVGASAQVLPLANSLHSRSTVTCVPNHRSAATYAAHSPPDAVVITASPAVSSNMRAYINPQRYGSSSGLPIFLEATAGIDLTATVRREKGVVMVHSRHLGCRSFAKRLIARASEYRYSQQLEATLRNTCVSDMQDVGSGLFDAFFVESYASALVGEGFEAAAIYASVYFPPMRDNTDTDSLHEVQTSISDCLTSNLPAAALCCMPAEHSFFVLLPETSVIEAKNISRALETALARLRLIDPHVGSPLSLTFRASTIALRRGVSVSRLIERMRLTILAS